ncbi:MAG TPA: NfeD family protein [Hyphomicrobium sp.]|jgi:inner membrane protein|nr:NfeD family protein [Hyphomicrobium sp.]
MEDFFAFMSSLGFWSWLVVALVLMALETIVPGVHFLWFGLAAFIVGLLVAVAGALGAAEAFPFGVQLVVFALIAVATVFGVKRMTGASPSDHHPDINAPGSQFIGRIIVVEDAITGGRGKVRAGDSVWLAEGEDAPAGTRVLVTGVNGTALVVTHDTEE